MAVEKQKSQLFLGIGYLFVAGIILINYVGQRSEPRGPLLRSDLAMSSSFTEAEVLRKKLEEERRLNSEMRKMVAEIQTYAGTTAPRGKGAQQLERMTAFDIERLVREGFPSVTSSFKSLVAKSSPFKVGRNPFVPFYGIGKTSRAATSDVMKVSMALRAHPILPILMQGAWTPVKIYEED